MEKDLFFDYRKEMNKMADNNKISIENFIRSSNPICREERQYALFLYNILRYYSTSDKRSKGGENVKSIFHACGLDGIVVDNVFYEATFMRDFFEWNRRFELADDKKEVLDRLDKKFSHKDYKIEIENSFNAELIKYLYKKEEKEEETLCGKCSKCTARNLGQKNIGCENLPPKIKYMARWMMNAKPDIAVVYHIDGSKEKKLIFLECKFCSSESIYSFGKESTDKSKTQRQIQGMIAEFLCDNKYLNLKMKISEKMEKNGGKESWLVRFVQKSEKKDGEILIEQLIEANDVIFGNQGRGKDMYL